MLGYLGSPRLGSKVRHVGHYTVKGTFAYCNTNSDVYCMHTCDMCMVCLCEVFDSSMVCTVIMLAGRWDTFARCEMLGVKY